MADGFGCAMYPPPGSAPQSEFKSDSSPVPIFVHNAPPHAMPGFFRTASPIEQVVTCRSAVDTPCSRVLSGWLACRDDSPCVSCSSMCMRSSSSSSSSLPGGPCPRGMQVRHQGVVPLFSFVSLFSFVVEESASATRHLCWSSMHWAAAAAHRVAYLAARCVQTFVITV